MLVRRLVPEFVRDLLVQYVGAGGASTFRSDIKCWLFLDGRDGSCDKRWCIKGMKFSDEKKCCVEDWWPFGLGHGDK